MWRLLLTERSDQLSHCERRADAAVQFDSEHHLRVRRSVKHGFVCGTQSGVDAGGRQEIARWTLPPENSVWHRFEVVVEMQ